MKRSRKIQIIFSCEVKIIFPLNCVSELLIINRIMRKKKERKKDVK